MLLSGTWTIPTSIRLRESSVGCCRLNKFEVQFLSPPRQFRETRKQPFCRTKYSYLDGEVPVTLLRLLLEVPVAAPLRLIPGPAQQLRDRSGRCGLMGPGGCSCAVSGTQTGRRREVTRCVMGGDKTLMIRTGFSCQGAIVAQPAALDHATTETNLLRVQGVWQAHPGDG